MAWYMRDPSVLERYLLSIEEIAAKLLLGERPITDAIPCEPLKMVQRLHGAFTAQPVERPEEYEIELSLGRRRKHLLELITVPTLPAGLIHVLVNDVPTLSGRESAELHQLTLCVMPSILR
jgi:hypothetical protein